MRIGRWITLAAVVLVSGLFAYFNAGERITVSLGFTVIYRVSLVRLVLGSFILGMVAMFLVGLRQDLELRRYLRDLDRRGPRSPAGDREAMTLEPVDADRARWSAPVRTPPRAEPD
jgi:uncharacterized integral membrane protein